jgi:pimeloyl-ACP methyl ester carboxylesterase
MGRSALVFPSPSPDHAAVLTSHRASLSRDAGRAKNVRGPTDHIPNARLFVVPDGGHWLLGHTEEVKSEITQFLRNNLAMVKHSTRQ